MNIDIKERAIGRWKSILMQLGMPLKALSGTHGPCPICDDGVDRFRFDDLEGRGTWICSKCGAGRGMELLLRWKRYDFKTAVEKIEGVIGKSSISVPKARMDDTKAREQMTAMWTRARPLDGRDAGSRYLRSRGLDLATYSPALRVLDDMTCGEEGEERTPCSILFAKYVAPDSQKAILHRTFIKPDGSGKAGVKKQRKMCAGTIPPGGAVRLSPAEATMGIAEGIETALSAEVMFDIPVWAATSSGALMKWEPPEQARRIIIFGDNDLSFTGQMAAYSLAYKLRDFKLKGDPKRRLEIEVALPLFRDTGLKRDWNDALEAELRMVA